MSLIRYLLAWQWACVLGFGGDSSSSSSSSNVTNTSTENTDKRQVVDNQSVGVSSDSSTVNVTSTDHDSVARSFDLAKTSSAQSLDTLNKALGFATDALKLANEGAKNVGAAYQTAQDAVGKAYTTSQDTATGTRFLIAGGLVVGGLVLANKWKGF